MGYRIVVILNNDRASEWQHDPELGQKIAQAMNYVNDPRRSDLGYGHVVECEHTSTQTIAVINGLHLQSLAYGSWTPQEPYDSVALKMVKRAAAVLGYTLTRKRTTRVDI